MHADILMVYAGGLIVFATVCILALLSGANLDKRMLVVFCVLWPMSPLVFFAWFIVTDSGLFLK